MYIYKPNRTPTHLPTFSQHRDVGDGGPVVLRAPAGVADEGPVAAAPVQEALALQVAPVACGDDGGCKFVFWGRWVSLVWIIMCV